MPWLSKPSPEETARLFKVLSGGRDLASDIKTIAPVPSGTEPPPQQPLKLQLPPKFFSVGDKTLLSSFKPPKELLQRRKSGLIEGLPANGSVFCGKRCRGINNHIKKELKETGYVFDLAKKIQEAKLDRNENLEDFEITRAGKNFILENLKAPPPPAAPQLASPPSTTTTTTPMPQKIAPLTIRTPSARRAAASSRHAAADEVLIESSEATAGLEHLVPGSAPAPAPAPPAKKETKQERITRVAGEIVANWGKVKLVIDAQASDCLFCHQARYISMDTVLLLSHLELKHDKEEIETVIEEKMDFCIERVKRQVRIKNGDPTATVPLRRQRGIETISPA